MQSALLELNTLNISVIDLSTVITQFHSHSVRVLPVHPCRRVSASMAKPEDSRPQLKARAHHQQASWLRLSDERVSPTQRWLLQSECLHT